MWNGTKANVRRQERERKSWLKRKRFKSKKRVRDDNDERLKKKTLRYDVARDLANDRSDHERDDYVVESERRRLRYWLSLKRDVEKYKSKEGESLLIMICEILGILSVATIVKGCLIIALLCKLLLLSKKKLVFDCESC